MKMIDYADPASKQTDITSRERARLNAGIDGQTSMDAIVGAAKGALRKHSRSALLVAAGIASIAGIDNAVQASLHENDLNHFIQSAGLQKLGSTQQERAFRKNEACLDEGKTTTSCRTEIQTAFAQTDKPAIIRNGDKSIVSTGGNVWSDVDERKSDILVAAN